MILYVFSIKMRSINRLIMISLLILSLLSKAQSSSRNYNTLVLPSFPCPNITERLRITNEMILLHTENRERYYSFNDNLNNESESEFYTRFESTCFEYISSYWPYHPVTGKKAMHNWGIQTDDDFKVEHMMTIPFPQLDNNSKILYVGGYENAQNANILYEKYQSHIIIIEPVLAFYRLLLWNRKIFEKDKEKISKFDIINKGLGKSDKKLRLSDNAIQADGTSFVKQNLDECNDSDGCLEIEIYDTGKLLSEMGLGNRNDITLLHLNCEGCEFEVMESLIEHKMLGNFPSIKLDTHYADYSEDANNPELIDRYCRIQYQLSKRFQLIAGVPFQRERWDRLELPGIYLTFPIQLPDSSKVLFKLNWNWDMLSSSKNLDYDEKIANQVTSFCDTNKLDEYICYQVWDHSIKMLLQYKERR